MSGKVFMWKCVEVRDTSLDNRRLELLLEI